MKRFYFPLFLALAILIAACTPATPNYPPLVDIGPTATINFHPLPPTATATVAPTPTATATPSIPQGTDLDATVFDPNEGNGYILISGDDRLFLATENRMRDGVAITGTKIIGSRFGGNWSFWLPKRLGHGYGSGTSTGAGINMGVYVSWTTGSTAIERNYFLSDIEEKSLLTPEEISRLRDITTAAEDRLLCYPTTQGNIALDFGIATYCPPKP